MKKILVSDLSGTLISNDEKELFWKENGRFDGERTVKKLIDELELFLNDDNYLYIVSKVDSHEGADFIYDNIIKYLYKLLEADNKEQVKTLFVSHDEVNKSNLKNIFPITNVNGRNVFVDMSNGAQITFVDKKTDVYDILKQDDMLEDNSLFAIGDNSNDVDMLEKCIELGGKSSFIEDYSMLDEEKLISVFINYKTHFKEYKELKKLIDNGQITNVDERLSFSLGSYYKEEYRKIKQELASTNINIEEIEKKSIVYEIINDYIREIDLKVDLGGLDLKDFKIPKYIDEYDVYHSFNDYCDNVLLSAKNHIKKKIYH